MIAEMWSAVLPEVFAPRTEVEVIIDDLSLCARAYQVLYALALGDRNYWPETLTNNEARCLVNLVRDMDGTTYLECLLARRMSFGMRLYVAEGK